ncbi:O-antigen ligase family protein [Clostridium sp. MSJ-11]|uniref:O-antigen ligase family protein n=1 Tax=Clostridium mobile TaxID=2841512 RepID=A0ABS6EJW0_9CLOT|nr:O-antigen ligase family protein [Clostridium mobile]MBU5485496.1 O-antigen ligase family protein [Clostridium mobile]
MEIPNKILSLLLYSYVLLLPILPSKFKIGKIPFNGDVILALLILFYLLMIMFLKDHRRKFIKGIKDFFTNYLDIFIFVLIAIMFISISYSVDKKIALGETLRFSTYIALYFIIKYELNEKKILDNILKLYIIAGTIISTIGIFEYSRGIGYVQQSEHGVMVRIFSTLENSNNLGVFMVIFIFPVIMLALNESNRRKKIMYIVISLLALANIILSFSRNAWVGLVIGCIILAITYNWKIIIGLFGLGGLSLFIPAVWNRVVEITDISQNLSRIKLWDIALMMIKDHPIRGVGNGNYRALYEEYRLLYKNKIEYYPGQNFHPHNIILKIQTELGIFGTISFIAMILSIATKLIKFINSCKDSFYKAFYKGFLASFIAFICMNFIDNFFSAPKVIAFFWILIAVFRAISYSDNRVGDFY